MSNDASEQMKGASIYLNTACLCGTLFFYIIDDDLHQDQGSLVHGRQDSQTPRTRVAKLPASVNFTNHSENSAHAGLPSNVTKTIENTCDDRFLLDLFDFTRDGPCVEINSVPSHGHPVQFVSEIFVLPNSHLTKCTNRTSDSFWDRFISFIYFLVLPKCDETRLPSVKLSDKANFGSTVTRSVMFELNVLSEEIKALYYQASESLRSFIGFEKDSGDAHPFFTWFGLKPFQQDAPDLIVQLPTIGLFLSVLIFCIVTYFVHAAYQSIVIGFAARKARQLSRLMSTSGSSLPVKNVFTDNNVAEEQIVSVWTNKGDLTMAIEDGNENARDNVPLSRSQDQDVCASSPAITMINSGKEADHTGGLLVTDAVSLTEYQHFNQNEGHKPPTRVFVREDGNEGPDSTANTDLVHNGSRAKPSPVGFREEKGFEGLSQPKLGTDVKVFESRDATDETTPSVENIGCAPVVREDRSANAGQNSFPLEEHAGAGDDYDFSAIEVPSYPSSQTFSSGNSPRTPEDTDWSLPLPAEGNTSFADESNISWLHDCSFGLLSETSLADIIHNVSRSDIMNGSAEGFLLATVALTGNVFAKSVREEN